MTQDEARAQWLTVLRDPKSKRNTGLLEDYDDQNKRCCLGHACHALGIERAFRPSKLVCYGRGMESSLATLPWEAQQLLGITYDGRLRRGVMVQDFFYSNLATLNDDTKIEPAEMADIIEEQFAQDNFLEPDAIVYFDEGEDT